MTGAPSWFAVDRKGLADILRRRGVGFAVTELIQNAFDTSTTTVHVTLTRVEGARATAHLVVMDDDPDGFKDLTHAYTLFAPSEKKADATKRGRFNLGEKLVLALCREASVVSTTGSVHFLADGTRATDKRYQPSGSTFTANVRMTAAEVEEATAVCQSLLVPEGVTLTFNGREMPHRAPRATVALTLQTEIADEEGVLRRSKRKTTVEIHEVQAGEVGCVYELGIPVVETEDPYHYNVLQKVPLSLERDNVPPSYLLALRTAALNTMHETLDAESANAAWARDAMESPDVAAEAVDAVLTARYGDKRVVQDPSDPEANKLAVMNGYTVIPSASFSRAAWGNIRTFGAALPAGRVTPSPKPFDENGIPLAYTEPTAFTPEQEHAVDYARRMGHVLLGYAPRVKLTDEPAWGFAAAFGHRELIINTTRVTFHDNTGHIAQEFDETLLHEFAHDAVSDHMSEAYHAELCRLGALFARWTGRLARASIRYSGVGS